MRRLRSLESQWRMCAPLKVQVNVRGKIKEMTLHSAAFLENMCNTISGKRKMGAMTKQEKQRFLVKYGFAVSEKQFK